MKKKLIVTVVVFGFLALPGAVFPAWDDIPAQLKQEILRNYPLDLLCSQEAARQEGLEVPPIEEHFEHGWIQVRVEDLSPSGPTVALVLYNWTVYKQKWNDHSFPEGGDFLLFRRSEDGWRRVDPLGAPGAILTIGEDTVQEPDVSLIDVDGDGTKEIFAPADIWKVTPSGLKAMTPVAVFPLPASEDGPYQFPQGEPDWCQTDIVVALGEDGWGSKTGNWLRDLDGDGKLELILGPDQERLPDPDPECTPQTCADYWQDVTGTRIYAIRDGVYEKVAETGVGRGLEPPLVVAMDPAALAQEALLMMGRDAPPVGSSAAGRVEGSSGKTTDKGTTDGALRSTPPVTLYVAPPKGYTMGEVDWSTVQVAGGDVTVQTDAGTHPAPDVESYPSWWLPNAFVGGLLYLEDVRKTRPADFSMTDDDPVVMMGPGGRLHFSSPYRVLRFERRAVLGWLAQQWRAGRADHKLKSCFTKDGREACYTPIGLPFTVRLRESLGPYPIVAHGLATLWVRN